MTQYDLAVMAGSWGTPRSPFDDLYGGRYPRSPVYEPPKAKRIDQMTPAEAKAEARKRIDDLKKRIARDKDALARLKQELAEWQQIAK